jgi:ABC-2 type transport system ATP-binding protein
MTTLSIEKLTKNYGKSAALEEFSFTLKENQLLAILGKNGNGKTTLMRCIMNLVHNWQGSVEFFNGLTMKDNRTRILQCTGFVPDQCCLPLHLTVEEILNISKNSWHLWDPVYCSSLLKQMELPLDKKIRELSKGMKAKLNLLIALSIHPRLLLMDEPTTGIDPESRDAILGVLSQHMSEFSSSIILCTHLLDEVEQLATDTLILNQNRISTVIDMETIYDDFVICETKQVKNMSNANMYSMDESHSLLDLRFHPETQLNSLRPATLKEIFIAICKKGAVK